MKKSTIGFIGAGNMGQAIIKGLLADQYPAEALTISNRSIEKIEYFQKDGCQTTTDNLKAVAADVVLLAVKPNQMAELCQSLKKHLQHNPVIISVAAGISSNQLMTWLDYQGPVVCAMPNTASAIGFGATGLFCPSLLSYEQKSTVEYIFKSVGISAWLEDEALINAVIALSGSAPAFYLYMMEIMSQHAISLGLDASTAHRFCTQTVLGVAQLAHANKHDYKKLREQITSPNGATFSGLECLRDHKFASLIEGAMHAAITRSKEMGKN